MILGGRKKNRQLFKKEKKIFLFKQIFFVLFLSGKVIVVSSYMASAASGDGGLPRGGRWDPYAERNKACLNLYNDLLDCQKNSGIKRFAGACAQAQHDYYKCLDDQENLRWKENQKKWAPIYDRFYWLKEEKAREERVKKLRDKHDLDDEM